LVVDVVDVVGPHGGSAGFVQEQNVSLLTLHCWRTALLQSLNSAPVKAPHAELTSSAHCFEPQSGGAAVALETKTPAPSTTGANGTTSPLITVTWGGCSSLACPGLLEAGAATGAAGEGHAGVPRWAAGVAAR